MEVTLLENDQMKYGSDYKFIPATSIGSGLGVEVVSDVYCYTNQIVNLCFIGEKNKEGFVIVDTGMPKSAEEIISVAKERFGETARPKAILLTHGHFDHVGSVIELVDYWEVPVYAHELEIPYLTGKLKYMEPDPTVEGGLVAKISRLFPNEPIDLGKHVYPLPADGTVPELIDWKWIHTPGHTDGHVSFYREKDRLLIVGDAFVTVKQEYLYDVYMQEEEISGPPRYFTPDWTSAWESVKKLEKLQPEIAITGHGIPMKGRNLRNNLKLLADQFDYIAIPSYGKYIN